MQISEGVIHRGQMDNTLLNLHNSSYRTQPHSVIANDPGFVLPLLCERLTRQKDPVLSLSQLK